MSEIFTVVEIVKPFSLDVLNFFYISPFIVCSKVTAPIGLNSFFFSVFGAEDTTNKELILIKSIIRDYNNYHSRMENLTDCEGSENSFYYDFTNRLLYIHHDHNINFFSHTWEYGKVYGFTSDKIRDFWGVPYKPEVRNIPNYRLEVDPLQYQNMAFFGGNIELANETAQWDSETNLLGNDIYCLIGQEGDDYSDLFLFALNYISNLRRNMTTCVFDSKDKREQQNIKIPLDTFTITDFPLINTDLIGKIKPEAYGSCRGIPGICIDENNAGNPKTFYFASTITGTPDFYAKKDDLWTAVTPTLIDNSNGTATFALVDCHVDGDSTKGLLAIKATGTFCNFSNPADIIAEWNSRFLGVQFNSSNYNIIEWSLEKVFLKPVGIYLKDQKNIYDWISLLQAGSTVGFQYMIENGKRTIRLDNPNRTTVMDVQAIQILNNGELEEDDNAELFSSHARIQYNQDNSDDLWESTENYDYYDIVFAQHRMDKQFDEDSLLTIQADAEDRAVIVMEDQYKVRPIAPIQVHGKEFFALRLFDLINAELSYPGERKEIKYVDNWIHAVDNALTGANLIANGDLETIVPAPPPWLWWFTDWSHGYDGASDVTVDNVNFKHGIRSAYFSIDITNSWASIYQVFNAVPVGDYLIDLWFIGGLNCLLDGCAEIYISRDSDGFHYNFSTSSWQANWVGTAYTITKSISWKNISCSFHNEALDNIEIEICNTQDVGAIGQIYNFNVDYISVLKMAYTIIHAVAHDETEEYIYHIVDWLQRDIIINNREFLGWQRMQIIGIVPNLEIGTVELKLRQRDESTAWENIFPLYFMTPDSKLFSDSMEFIYYQKLSGTISGGLFNNLTQSFYKDSTNPAASYLCQYSRVWVYDSALAIYAKMAYGDFAGALTEIQALIRIMESEDALGFNGVLHFSYNTIGDDYVSNIAPLGSIAWVLKAIYVYSYLTSDTQFLAYLATKMTWILTQQITNPADARYGFFRAGLANVIYTDGYHTYDDRSADLYLWITGDEAAGLVCADSSAEGNDCTLHGTVAPTMGNPGIAGNCITLDGTDQYGTLSDDPLGAGFLEFSMSAWYKRNAYVYGSCVYSNYIPATGGIKFIQEVGLNVVGFTLYDTTKYKYITYSLPVGFDWSAWHHWVMVWISPLGIPPNQKIEIWLDNVKVLTETVGIPDWADMATANYYIGRYTDGALNYYTNGQIDEFCVYNKALSTTEIGKLYAYPAFSDATMNYQMQHCSIEHNADMIDLLTIAYEVTGTAAYQTALTLLLAQIYDLWVTDHFVTGIDSSGNINYNVAIDNNTWVASALLQYDEETAWKCIDYVYNNFIITSPEGYLGCIFFTSAYSDDYVTPNPDYEKMIQPEATFGFIHLLIQYADLTANTERRSFCITLAKELYQSMLYFKKNTSESGIGIPYASMDILNMFSTIDCIASSGTAGYVTAEMANENLRKYFIGMNL